MFGLLRLYDTIYVMNESREPAIGHNTLPDSKGLGGRPPKLTTEERREVYEELEKYIKETDDPTVPEFISTNWVALGYDIIYQNLYDWKEFSGLIKRLVRKQEAYLIREGTQNKINTTMAIFRLKQPQHGYRDRQELTGADGKDLVPEVNMTAGQAEQLLALRAAREDSSV
jgi:hypothetical protein